ncbi:hypothetical protein HMPREF1015_01844 [Bacillus smithii 7_3_47FAA]|uniref:Uncharacterized protein n=1 Tax=Bacillus smithii 7_3_47FAA TaxID=665952 RepID=G9QJG1_9BACI|nr:hypothetical protein HMPREF1015_01844 [Bacillus smithii 7_3_47FAA]
MNEYTVIGPIIKENVQTVFGALGSETGRR